MSFILAKSEKPKKITAQQRIKKQLEKLNSRWYNRWLTVEFTKRVEAILKEGDHKPNQ
jgi:predicted Co/Zn/Cd cation transporter (cation efflux family)